jgi:DNA replication and repair protein RecF
VELRWISLRTFRSYTQLHFEPEAGINLLVGDNGAGKTNLLEAVAYLGNLRSFRQSPDEALVATDSDRAYVRAEIGHASGASLLELEIPRSGGRKVLLDRQRLGRIAELVGAFRVITFIPEDLEVIKGGPGARRAFLDETAVQLWPAAYQEQAEFERTLRQRNALLKGVGSDAGTLDVWDARLAQIGGKVVARRARAAEALVANLSELHLSISASSGARFGYSSSWGAGLDPTVPAGSWAELLRSALSANRRRDKERGSTTVGPHRDEPELTIGDRDARHLASQGEQRTLALVLRLAAHSAVQAQIREAPVLLLDDVFSELDATRAKALTAALPECQILITAARPEQVPLSGRAWMVAGGGVT